MVDEETADIENG
jgi:SNF2 family DNA or RNA helicase